MSGMVSINGIDLIKESESLELTAYKDPVGVWTIGWGHTKTAKAGMTISKAQATALLSSDLQDSLSAVNRYVTAPLNQNQLDALVSFTFNLGSGNLQKSTLVKKINANPNDPAIENEFKRWVYAGGNKLNGLVTRRAKEANLYFSKMSVKKKASIALIVLIAAVLLGLWAWKTNK